MKKILFCLILLLAIPVNAKDSRLYFNEKDKKLYYDSSILDKNIFMNHTDMLPGSIYQDRLLIENDSNKDFTLYFKVKVEDQSSESLELLDNIEMKLYLDDQLIYDGLSTGIDYKENGINLLNSIKIGEIKSKSSVNLDATVKLKESYSNIDNQEYSFVDWYFYAEYDDSIEVIVPKTDIEESKIYKIVGFIIFGVAIISIAYHELNVNKKKKIKK